MTPDPEAAVSAAQQAVQDDPRTAGRYDGLARALLAAGRCAEAEQAVRTAEALEPGGPDRLLVLAAAQAGLGRRDQARRTLFAVLTQDSQHAEARRLLAGLRPPSARHAPAGSGNRALRVPALVMVLIGTVLLMLRLTVAAAACLTLGAVLLLGGFPGNRSERADRCR